MDADPPITAACDVRGAVDDDDDDADDEGRATTEGGISVSGGDGIVATSSLVFGVNASSPMGEIGENPSGGPELTERSVCEDMRRSTRGGLGLDRTCCGMIVADGVGEIDAVTVMAGRMDRSTKVDAVHCSEVKGDCTSIEVACGRGTPIPDEMEGCLDESEGAVLGTGAPLAGRALEAEPGVRLASMPAVNSLSFSTVDGVTGYPAAMLAASKRDADH